MVSVHCAVNEQTVVRVTDFEDATVRVICADFEVATATCRIKRLDNEGGPLSRLLTRVSEQTVGRRGVRCDFA